MLEKKADAGDKLHTTGIIVKEAVEHIALLDGLPGELVRRVTGVRLYAPNLRHVDLDAPGYYFLATDTPEVMRWLARKAQSAGAEIAYGSVFTGARRVRGGFDLGALGRTRYLVGADGPRSRVASSLGLGSNDRCLFGIEHEFAAAAIGASDRMHCFVDRKVAPGYIAWMVAGVRVVQVGLARRVARGQTPAPAAMAIAARQARADPRFPRHAAGRGSGRH